MHKAVLVNLKIKEFCINFLVQVYIILFKISILFVVYSTYNTLI